eukprot:Rhum_TRINITY_DN14827_c3_g1::Rhum_TRINITY_DN14827_c3_g1_i1::g.122042::m.122042
MATKARLVAPLIAVVALLGIANLAFHARLVRDAAGAAKADADAAGLGITADGGGGNRASGDGAAASAQPAPPRGLRLDPQQQEHPQERRRSAEQARALLSEALADSARGELRALRADERAAGMRALQKADDEAQARRSRGGGAAAATHFEIVLQAWGGDAEPWRDSLASVVDLLTKELVGERDAGGENSGSGGCGGCDFTFHITLFREPSAAKPTTASSSAPRTPPPPPPAFEHPPSFFSEVQAAALGGEAKGSLLARMLLHARRRLVEGAAAPQLPADSSRVHLVYLPPYVQLLPVAGWGAGQAAARAASFFTSAAQQCAETACLVAGTTAFAGVLPPPAPPSSSSTPPLPPPRRRQRRHPIVSHGVDVHEAGAGLVFAEALAGYSERDARLLRRRPTAFPSPESVVFVSLAFVADAGGAAAQALAAAADGRHLGLERLEDARPYDAANPYSLTMSADVEALFNLTLCATVQGGAEAQAAAVSVLGAAGTSHAVFSGKPGWTGIAGVAGVFGRGAVRAWSGTETSSPGLPLAGFSRPFQVGRSPLLRKTYFNFPVKVVWETFCIRCFGFTNEVMHFVAPLEARTRAVQSEQGTDCFCPGSPASFTQALSRAAQPKQFTRWRQEAASSETADVVVWVQHKDPGSFTRSYGSLRGRRPDYVVGRSMYEFTRIDPNWLPKANDDDQVDELWVPSTFVWSVFKKNGIRESKLVVVPEPVDVHQYAPHAASPYALPHRAFRSQCSPHAADPSVLGGNYKFLSVFKLEDRKGWDVLLAAYLAEFKAGDRVSLYLACYIWGEADSRNPAAVMRKVLAKAKELGYDPEALPHIEVVTQELTEAEMVRLYRSVDAFAMPTRGEGWGLPIIQAMSMALPAIATNWSGNVDFMRSDNSMLLEVDRIEKLPAGSPYGSSEGKYWAQPSTSHLRQLMRRLVDRPEEGRAIGARAREFVVDNYSDEVIAAVVEERLLQIREKVVQRRRAKKNK